MDWTVVDLDSSHHAYFREQFALHASNARLLGRLLSDLDLTQGRSWAIVPAERAQMALGDLGSEPIQTDREREELAAATAARLAGSLGASARQVLAFEYWTATYLDGNSPIREFKVAHSDLEGDSVFDYVTGEDSKQQVERLLLTALWFPTVGVVAPVPADVELESRAITADQLEEVVARLDLVLVGAWGANGYVFWEPSSA
jgi:hypothetical protein